MLTSDPLRTHPRMGAWMMLVGAAGLGLGASGLVMIFALPAVGLVGYGALLAVVGLVQLAELGRQLSQSGRAIRLLLALLYLASGAALMIEGPTDPLARLVAVLFCAAGAFRIVWSFAWPKVSRTWGLAAGLATAGLGLMLLASKGGWLLSVLGIAVALDLAAYGLSAFFLGRALRR